jgi:predicted Zn-dependent protease
LHLNAKQKECITNFKRLSHSSLVSNKQNFEWTVHFIKDDSTINAFCIPGGHMFVYTGLLNLCTSNDEIAGVIAHEIAHAEKRHSINQLAQQIGFQMILESILGLNSSWLGLGTQLMQLKFSRADELEADEFAFYLLNENGFKSDALISFFNKMKLSNQVQIVEFVSTHPETDNRILAIEKLKSKNSN